MAHPMGLPKAIAHLPLPSSPRIGSRRLCVVREFGRIGAATAMRVEDVYVQNRRLWVNLREKGGKAVALPCHHNLEPSLHAYLDGAGLASDPQGPLFRTLGRGTGQ